MYFYASKRFKEHYSKLFWVFILYHYDVNVDNWLDRHQVHYHHRTQRIRITKLPFLMSLSRESQPPRRHHVHVISVPTS